MIFKGEILIEEKLERNAELFFNFLQGKNLLHIIYSKNICKGADRYKIRNVVLKILDTKDSP